MLWFNSLRPLGKLIVAAIAALLLVAAFLAVRALFVGDLGVKAKLGRNQANAALQSGHDAVDTVGAQQAAESATDAITRANEAEIRNAPGADAKVAPEASQAGIRAICRRAAAKDDPRCAKP
jgi:hypothetical protein